MDWNAVREASGNGNLRVRERASGDAEEAEGGEETVIHYSIRFWLREGVSEPDLLQRINAFLADQKGRGAIDGFTLLRNRAPEQMAQFGPLQALITFRTAEQFSSAFEEVGRTGIHSGLHGSIVELVSRFQAETFDVIDASVGLRTA